MDVERYLADFITLSNKYLETTQLQQERDVVLEMARGQGNFINISMYRTAIV